MSRHKEQPSYKFAQYIFKVWKKKPVLMSKQELCSMLGSLSTDSELNLDQDVLMFIEDL